MIVVAVVAVVIVVLLGFSAFFGAPYVPTRRRWAAAALDLAELNKDDVVVDLGSGDGAVLKLAAERGARAIGYEISPILYLTSRLRTAKCIPKVRIHLANYWTIDLPPGTTVVYVFSVGRDTAKLAQYLDRQRIQGLCVITFGFELPGHQPIRASDGAKLYRLPSTSSNR